MTLLDAPAVEEARRWLRTDSARVARFRSGRLRPSDELLGNPLGYAMDRGDPVIAACVEKLRRLRSSLVRELGAGDSFGHDEPGGRLLVSSILESVVDSASAASSNGWFDEVDLPPWDTWLCYGPLFPDRSPYTDALVSYVPKAYLSDVQRGIDVNPVNCHSWATKGHEKVLERLLGA